MKKKFIGVSLAIVLSMAQIISVGAAKEDDIKAAKAQTSSQLAAVNNKINKLEDQKAALKAEINELDQDLVEVIVQIDVLKDDITTKETEIEDTKEDLKVAEENRDEQYASMKKRIQYIYEKGGDSAWAQMLLEADSLSGMLSKAEYTQQLYDYDRNSLNELKEVVQQVTDLETQLETEKAELEDMQVEYEGQQKELESTLEQKKATASDYESQISRAESQAAEYKELIQQQNAELQKIQEEKAAAAAAAKKAEEEAQKKAAQKAAQESSSKKDSDSQKSDDNKSSGNSKKDNNNSNSSNEDTDEEDSRGNSSNTSKDDEDNSSKGESSSNSSKGDSSSNSSSSSSGSSSSSSSSATGQAIVNYATQFVGNPYVWGGESLTNGADCSGFTMQVYAHFGISLPHSSGTQRSYGRAVSYAEAQPGDLICYSGHVAIYMGGGQIVHASNSAPYPKGGIKISGNAAYKTILSVRRLV